MHKNTLCLWEKRIRKRAFTGRPSQEQRWRKTWKSQAPRSRRLCTLRLLHLLLLLHLCLEGLQHHHRRQTAMNRRSLTRRHDTTRLWRYTTRHEIHKIPAASGCSGCPKGWIGWRFLKLGIHWIHSNPIRSSCNLIAQFSMVLAFLCLCLMPFNAF